MQEFRINKYLTLKLDNESTGIYVDDELFSKCKFLLLNVPTYNRLKGDEDSSIDEVSKYLDDKLEIRSTPKELGLTPEDEFRGHCSNLQVWFENNYNPRLLHSDLAFPLLKKLTDAGDPLAKKIFKNEMHRRFASGHSAVITYLIAEGYLDYLNLAEFETFLDNLDLDKVKIDDLIDGIIEYYQYRYGQKYVDYLLNEFTKNLKLKRRYFYFPLLKKLASTIDPQPKKRLKDEIASRFLDGNDLDREFLRTEGYLDYLSRDALKFLIGSFFYYPLYYFTLEGHIDRVNTIKFSTDSNYLISGGGPFDRTIKIWELSTGNLIRTLYGHTSNVESLTVTTDGKYIISCSWDKTIKIWDFVSGDLINSLSGHKSWIRTLALTPDNNYIVSGSGDNREEEFNINIWDISTGKLFKTLKGHKKEVNAVIVSSEGKFLISGSNQNRNRDYTLIVWDLSEGEIKYTLGGYTKTVLSLATTPDGKYLVSGSDDKTISIWDLQSAQLIRTLEDHKHHVWTLAISPDGKYIVSGSGDGTVKIWELKTGKLIQTLIGHSSDVFSDRCWIYTVAISPDGKYTATGAMDNRIKVWKIDYSKF
jgi:WD40 repeat protein